MLKTTHELLKDLDFYKNYVDKVSEIKITNRINSKLEMHCRYLRVPRNKDSSGNNFIVCDYGQPCPDLQECIECMGVVDFKFGFYEKIIEGLTENMRKKPENSDFCLSGITMWQEKIIEKAKKVIEEFLKKLEVY